MLRSLHRKLVLILVLLIISLMAVVGAFLMSGVTGFYTREFHTQMSAIWQDPQFVSALTEAAMGESPVADMAARLDAHTGQLGVDEDRRNYYILDGQTGAKLYTSDPADQQPDITPNIVSALAGRSGSASSMTEPYFDVAFPIGGYIVYIRDNKETLRTQNDEMFMIILEALLFGLGISILLSFLLSKTMTTPIESLTRTARRVAAGDFSSPPQAHSAD
jgi:two-component system sensor histidine kinase VicK